MSCFSVHFLHYVMKLKTMSYSLLVHLNFFFSESPIHLPPPTPPIREFFSVLESYFFIWCRFECICSNPPETHSCVTFKKESNTWEWKPRTASEEDGVGEWSEVFRTDTTSYPRKRACGKVRLL